MFVTEEKNGKLYALPAAEVKRFPSSALSMKILSLLAKEDLYPKEISRRLRENEQKIYYHVRQLEKAGVIVLSSTKELAGATAKIYRLKKPAFFIRLGELAEANRIPKTSRWLEPFIIGGKLNAKIIVGSPDPHGVERARARDAYYGIDLGLFLGTFLVSSHESVALDTDVTETKENMILIGGPVINRITNAMNKKLPLRFDRSKNIYSSITKRTYKNDDCGVIVKTRNPFDESKWVLLIAGKRYSGTRAAILAILNRFAEVEKKNAHVVEGVDSDGDGVVDGVKMVE